MQNSRSDGTEARREIAAPRSLRPGQTVHVRRRRWRVRDVHHFDDCAIVTLSPADATQAIDRRIISPFDTIERRTASAPVQNVQNVQNAQNVRRVSTARWRRAARSLIAAHTPPGGLRAARTARIDLLPHQLEPALAIVRGRGVRLLLADGVGLGKTIQAGLIVAELRERGDADRVLILTPAGLREQWAAELRSRFSIDAEIVDARGVRRLVAELPIGMNPWSTVPVAIASIDFVKRPEILASVARCRWDVLIVDEAHNVAGDSDRHSAVSAIASRAPYVVLVTATPHSGDPRTFNSLCQLGSHGEPLLAFRRTRRDVSLTVARKVRLLQVRPSPAERRMHELVAQVTCAARGRASSENLDAVWLALSVLNKRALSSAGSLLQTVERRLSGLAGMENDDSHQPELPMFDADGETDEVDSAPDLIGLSPGDPHQERRWLRALAGAARIAAERETKIATIGRFIRRLAEPVVVFTEYRDTLLQLCRAMPRPSVLLHGGLSREERFRALASFVSGSTPVLLATDAAGEGLNLHERCRTVINLELPWNPTRLEQRIGRVDRIGQRRTVHAVHLVARDTAETRILDRLRARIARARHDIGADDPIGDQFEDDERVIATLVIDGDAPDARCAPAAPADVVSLEASREAAGEVERLDAIRRVGLFTPDFASTSADVPEDTWLTFARNRRTRSALRNRLLALFRATYEDEAGRVLESTLVPIAVRLDVRRLPRGDFESLLRAMESALLDCVDESTAGWREQASSMLRNSARARLDRQRMIATRLGSPSTLFQPGLFDRRADLRHAQQTALTTSLHEDAAWQFAAIEQMARATFPPPRLLLVLAHGLPLA